MKVDVKKIVFRDSYFKREYKEFLDDLKEVEKKIRMLDGRLKRAKEFGDDARTINGIEYKVYYELYTKKRLEVSILNLYLNYLRDKLK